MIASVRELIEQERKAGSPDYAIARLLNASSIKPPPGHRHWQVVAIRQAVGEDPSGYRPDGHPGLGLTNEQPGRGRR